MAAASSPEHTACVVPGCQEPMTGLCEICKQPFCKAHMKTGNVTTADGRAQYGSFCQNCYVQALADKRGFGSDTSRTLLQLAAFAVLVAAIVGIVWWLFSLR